MINVDRAILRGHIETANWHFTLARSSLQPLINALGGLAPAGTLPGAPAAMTGMIAEDPLIDAIMGNPNPAGAAPIAAMPLAKRQKYRAALGYIFGLMGLPAAARLVEKDHREVKVGWGPHLTFGDEHLIHACNIAPAAIHASGGLDPQYSSEMCTSNAVFGGGAAWPTHEFVFFFERVRANPAGVAAAAAAAAAAGVAAPRVAYAPLRIPPAAGRFGFGQYLYLLRPPGAPAPLTFWSTAAAVPAGGAAPPPTAIGPGKEIAFPGLVPIVHLIPYAWDGATATQLTWAGAVVPAAARIQTQRGLPD